jgi:hypothetical protein
LRTSAKLAPSSKWHVKKNDSGVNHPELVSPRRASCKYGI